MSDTLKQVKDFLSDKLITNLTAKVYKYYLLTHTLTSTCYIPQATCVFFTCRLSWREDEPT